jgi:hypothetical protein
MLAVSLDGAAQQIAEIFDIMVATQASRLISMFGDFQWPFSNSRFRAIQWINPVTWFMSGNNISANVYLGESSSTETEAEILDQVGTYGRQLGQIADAMIVVLKYLPDRESLSPEESKVIKKFEKMACDIVDIKEKHKRPAVRP